MSKFSLRKILLNIHIYSGLLCFSYLLIFGISSLLFNHPFAFTQAAGAPVTWQQTVALHDFPRVPASAPADQNPLKARANFAVGRALDLFGYQIGYASSWKTPDLYHAVLIRPGKKYDIDVHLDTNLAVVTETPSGVWDVVKQLHGLAGTMPGSALVSTWAWYTELCAFTVVFSALSGIYLWTRRKSDRRLGLLMLSSALTLSIAVILYITFHG